MGVFPWFSLVWCVCWIHVHETLGSEVTLTAYPATITKGLTESLKLRCSLPDTATVSDPGVVVGRQVSGTDYDIDHVNSIIISRVNANETVTSLAEIMTGENANILGGPQTLTADGTLTPSDPSDPEYLELTWTKPGEDQSGSYICEVNGLDPVGHSVTLQQSLAVDIVDPEVEDLVSEINDLKSILYVLTPQIGNLVSQISNMNAILATLKAPHNEEGSVNCGNSDSWANDGSGTKTIVQSVTFQQPYTSPPTVVVAETSEDADGMVNDRYGYYARDVTTTGFNVVCYTWADSHIYGLGVHWTSFVS